MKTLKAAILGATGMAGVEYPPLLENHPWFKITTLCGRKSVGKLYGEAVRSLSNAPRSVAELEVIEADPKKIDADIVFSALPSEVARKIEGEFIEAGFPVVSETSAYRMEKDVPLMMPEINAEHLHLVEKQKQRTGGGFIVTTPNCTTVGLVMPLKPLLDEYGLEKVVVATYQAVTGAGWPGVPSYSIIANVIPYIRNEEPKVEAEAKKILGTLGDGEISPARFPVEASCARVPTIDGHLEAVYVETSKPVNPEEAARTLEEFEGAPQKLGLPTAPEKPIIVSRMEDRPQPRFDVMAGSVPGMSVVVGRIRGGHSPNVLKFYTLSHNRIRGAAGVAVLTAELLYAQGYLR